ncbi:hypothetical protein FDP08_03655 [Marinobacter panjinensis]|uniref:Uncharacterized protein n=1 Tax=Marinobacter panjinensis TaxID=2576384 RepID=A0A4U6R4N1_9GAMM|nr:hypothetical protein [Marinobacter panjinensis]MCR8915772.1 hypothetical protein [Marinobacter panjinensis]TKV67246.1 hypothetical protein FDP08_03655 [Marinobacter panjinensis]
MPLRALLTLTVVVSGAIGLGYLLAAENPGRFAWITGANHAEPLPDASDSQVPALANSSSPPPKPKPPDNAVGFMLASAANQYTQNIRYPEYSIPLSEDQAQAYRGNRFEPVELPLEGDGRFTVTLEKYRFVQDEDILVVATITGSSVVSDRLEVTLESTESRQQHASSSLKNDSGDSYYEGVISADAEPGEYRLIVEASVDGKPVRHASTLTIEPDLGEFDGLGSPRVSNNDLVIPVHFDANEPGFYALAAQLYHNGRAVAQLQAEKRLDGTTDTLELKAHGSVLANREITGELELRNLQIRRLPARPGDRTDYGFGPEEGYSFSPPDLDGLTDSPASDPESEQRAALLQKLADKF